MTVRVRSFRAPSGDNYAYVLYPAEGEDALLVDPVAPGSVRRFLEEHQLTPSRLINTHGHGDHTSANATFRDEEDVRVLCHPRAASRLDGVEETLSDEQVLSLGTESIRVLHTPGHSPGSLCLVTDEALISGDTVFLAGCGNPKYGGDTDRLFETFQHRLRPLDDELRLYPGHDYAEKNLRFALDREPDNDAARRKLDEVREARQHDEEPASTLGEEKSYNPFFRFDRPSVVEGLSDLSRDADDREVFRALRALRNRW